MLYVSDKYRPILVTYVKYYAQPNTPPGFEDNGWSDGSKVTIMASKEVCICVVSQSLTTTDTHDATIVTHWSHEMYQLSKTKGLGKRGTSSM